MPTVEQLLEMLAQRDVVIEGLQAQIVELERRLGQNSKNSSRPPSGDRMERSPARAEQGKTGRKPGKQPGGPGSTLRRTDTPDAVIEHAPTECDGCGAGLDGAPVVKTRARQMLDIPEVSASVTEHQIHSRRCVCGQVTEAPAPPRPGRARRCSAGRTCAPSPPTWWSTSTSRSNGPRS